MIVVTGAGLIGGRIIAALAREAGDVVVVDSELTARKRARWAGASLRDELTPERLLELGDADREFSGRVDAVIHTGAITDTWDRATSRVLESNVLFSTRLLRWCLDRRIPLVYASSSTGTKSRRCEPGSPRLGCVKTSISPRSRSCRWNW